MENSSTNLEPTLPPELEREIFEFAALWYPTTITSLLRVCHRVHSWINPFLYTVLPLVRSGRMGHVEKTLRAKPFLRRPIGHVLVDLHSFDDADWIALLRLTSSPTQEPPEFAMKGLDVTAPGLKGVFVTLPLITLLPQRLAFEFLRQDATSGIFDTLSPYFVNLTHLTLLHADPYEWVFWRSWEHLTTLPALTHLCLSANISRVILPHVLKDCPALQAVLTTWLVPAATRARVEAFSFVLRTPDPRVVVTNLPDFFEEWKRTARCGYDVWVRVDEFIARKRRGEIEASNYLLDDIVPRIFC